MAECIKRGWGVGLPTDTVFLSCSRAKMRRRADGSRDVRPELRDVAERLQAGASHIFSKVLRIHDDDEWLEVHWAKEPLNRDRVLAEFTVRSVERRIVKVLHRLDPPGSLDGDMNGALSGPVAPLSDAGYVTLWSWRDRPNDSAWDKEGYWEIDGTYVPDERLDDDEGVAR
ncbi:hypothetical protein roselon_00599 [Roseibacterium elongatum DSM 19469]|uniref:Uncharacterized protein n=1 Tax=Roseicyclus elongatus DSM 19469 TaxID=1294273 RepID=W8RPF9_9RHOB|nr:hypothetical protein [Roseibacterium elongatum]AHM03039.1 hypothetical protein roselon_00599 [Roseibacterium elongatum DSM 19469]